MDDLSFADVENILLQIKQCENRIALEKDKCDQSVSFYQQFIANAKKIFDDATKDDRLQIDFLKSKLQRYFNANPPTNRKSLKFAAGSFGYNKASTKFFLNGLECNADNKALLSLCQNDFKNFCQVKQYVDWASLKKNLDFDEPDLVYLKDTGEVISGLRAERVFSVKTN